MRNMWPRMRSRCASTSILQKYAACFHCEAKQRVDEDDILRKLSKSQRGSFTSKSRKDTGIK